MILHEIRSPLLIALALVLAQIFLLQLFGQPFLSRTGEVMLWAGDVFSIENSQQLSDWYTFSHIVHGFFFYALFWYFLPRLSLWQRLALSVGVEVGWEVLENTPMVINLYREQALAQGYVGDSILNSVSDTLAMVVGFFLAWRLPIWATIALAIGFEGFTLYMIRDGLMLNILGFIWTPEFIANWQSGN